MSLAMSAAPFHSNEHNYSNKEKKPYNKTIKNNSSSKVTSALNTLHSFNEEDESLSNFNPLPPPTIQQKPQNEKKNFNPYKNEVQENDNEKMDLNNLESNFLTQEKANDYYKNLFSTSNTQNIPKHNYYNNYQQLDQLETSNYNVLLNKLNYMIHLLEENKDEKTNNVIEEVVLYSFLGIFIIFLVDSFTKVGKYVR